MTSQKRNLLIVFILIGIFIIPGWMARLLYMHPTWWHAKPINRGLLLSPPIQLFKDSEENKWGLALWVPQSCGHSCMTEFSRLKQIRLALGRRFFEVNLLLVRSDKTELTHKMQQKLEKRAIRVVTLSPAMRDTLAKQWPEPRLLILDLRHYAILAYPTTAPSDDIFHDLKQVMTNTLKAKADQ